MDAVSRKPFLPEDLVRNQPRDTLWRAANAACKAYAYKRSAEDFLRRDEAALEVYRAAVNPMAIGSGGAANPLAATAVVDAIIDLGASRQVPLTARLS